MLLCRVLPYLTMRTYKRKKERVDRQKIWDCLTYMHQKGVSLNKAAAHFNHPEATVRWHMKHRLAQGETPPLSPGVLKSLPSNVEAELAMMARTAATHDPIS